MKKRLLLIGHRGTRTNYDENTINSFKKAIEYGAEYIEFDVRRSKDGKLIILHDSTLDRTTNGSGLLKNFNFEEICNFKTLVNQDHIPLLSEVLFQLRGKIKFMIELKEESLKEEVGNLIEKNKLLYECVFSGRNLEDLKFIKETYPESKVCYNITKGVGLTIKDFLKLGMFRKLSFSPNSISLRSNLISSDFIEICHKNEILSLTWDFLQYANPLEKIKSLVNLGIDGILFDNHKNIPKIKDWFSSV